MRHALNFQLGLHARGPGRDSYKGVDEWKTPASVSLDRSLIRAAPSHKVLPGPTFGHLRPCADYRPDRRDAGAVCGPPRADGPRVRRLRDGRESPVL